jgi:hypothetical protein
MSIYHNDTSSYNAFTVSAMSLNTWHKITVKRISGDLYEFLIEWEVITGDHWKACPLACLEGDCCEKFEPLAAAGTKIVQVKFTSK